MKQRIPQSFCNLNFPHTITRWDEAVPLGNGVCGALIWGAADALRFSLDRGYIRVNLPENSFRFRIENPQFGLDSDGPEERVLADSVNTASLKVLRYPAPEILEGQDMRYFVQTVSGDFSYGIFVKAKEEKGHTLLVYTVETGVKDEKRRRDVLAELEEALETGYEKALAEHCKW